jgi:hypothetical protein
MERGACPYRSRGGGVQALVWRLFHSQDSRPHAMVSKTNRLQYVFNTIAFFSAPQIITTTAANSPQQSYQYWISYAIPIVGYRMAEKNVIGTFTTGISHLSRQLVGASLASGPTVTLTRLVLGLSQIPDTLIVFTWPSTYGNPLTRAHLAVCAVGGVGNSITSGSGSAALHGSPRRTDTETAAILEMGKEEERGTEAVGGQAVRMGLLKRVVY